MNPHNGSAQELPIESLVLSALQPRKIFDAKTIERLSHSIRSVGVLQPILVRGLEANRYEIIAGERRYHASKKAGKTTIPAIVRAMNDNEALEAALLENLQRQDLNELEETEGVLNLLALHLSLKGQEVVSLLYRMDNESKAKVAPHVTNNGQGKTVVATFQALGRMTWQSFTSTRLPLLKLPSDVLEALRAGVVSPPQARIVAQVADLAERKNLLKFVATQSPKVSVLRAHVAALRGNESFQISKTKHWRNPWMQHVWRNPTHKDHADRLLDELERLILQDQAESSPQW